MNVASVSYYSVFSFRCMFVAGEHCDQETLHWVRDRFQVPCLDHWWQTGKNAALYFFYAKLLFSVTSNFELPVAFLFDMPLQKPVLQ